MVLNLFILSCRKNRAMKVICSTYLLPLRCQIEESLFISIAFGDLNSHSPFIFYDFLSG